MRWKNSWMIALVVVILFTSINTPAQHHPTSAQEPTPAHPRLWVRTDDLPRLRSWATPANPIYTEILVPFTEEAIRLMDAGTIPAGDTGEVSWVEYPTENYSQLFAFMSLIAPDEAARADYAQRARTLLMYVMNQAVLGPAPNEPFRDPAFALTNRSRWFGSGFGLTVDWIYPVLSAEDKATIRTVFLRWIDENIHADTTNYNHPEPIGLTNDPALISDPITVRWASNNYYAAHMRNIALMALAFDPADDPDGALAQAIENATGAWWYVTDHLLRTDAAGGLGAEGFEYSPQSLGYTAQFLLALYTAGYPYDFSQNPFWDESIPAYLHSLSPTAAENSDYGTVYQPAWYGSGQNYYMADHIEMFGPMGVYDSLAGNTERLDTLRWIQLHTAPGGETNVIGRLNNFEWIVRGILYYLLFDPTAPAPSDPRPALPTLYYAPGIDRILARTDWSEDAAWLSYGLSWDSIDHQSGNGNAVEFYRNGEWLTKVRVGYDLDYITSDNLNTLTVQNGRPTYDDYRLMIWERGSQWLYSAGDPPPPVFSLGDGYLYIFGDSTNLYNSEYEELRDVQHVSRSILWLQPDTVVIYDRAATSGENQNKSFWLNLPENATVDGTMTSMTTANGQQLVIHTLQPTGASIQVNALQDEPSGAPANFEPMHYRLHVTDSSNPSAIRFLHVLQGADAGVASLPVSHITSTAGTPYEGAIVGDTAILFIQSIDTPFDTTTYSVPTGVRQIVTGLAPSTAYDVAIENQGEVQLVTLTLGTSVVTDAAGVLIIQ